LEDKAPLEPLRKARLIEPSFRKDGFSAGHPGFRGPPLVCGIIGPRIRNAIFNPPAHRF
jgi:hypothetical protein